MTTLSRADVTAQLIELESAYWYDVDRNWGRNAHEMYVDDGLFVVGDTRMEGKEGVKGFYQWRLDRGDRTARHLVSNFHLLAFDESEASLACVMCLYAADGVPVLESRPAILMADVVSDCVRGADGQWRFKSHVLTPVFMGGVKPTLPGKM